LNNKFQVIVSSPSRLAPYTCSVDPSLNRLGRALASGNTETIAKAVIAHQALRGVVVHKVFNLIDEECAALCRRAEPTSFRKTSLKELQEFTWSKYVGEMEAKSPLLLELFKMIVGRSDSRNDHKHGSFHFPGICTAVAVLLKERNREMVGLQTFLSLVLFTSHVQKQVCYCIVRVHAC
jgi:hypothetical protein